MSLLAVRQNLEQSRRCIEASQHHLAVISDHMQNSREFVEHCRLCLEHRWPAKASVSRQLDAERPSAD